LRRRLTFVTLAFEMEYLSSFPTGTTDSKNWLQGVGGGSSDILANLIFVESGAVTTYTIAPPDNDGKSQTQSGKWQVDSKDYAATGDGSMALMVTFRNEGAWVLDHA
jgi:hypothetical protein